MKQFKLRIFFLTTQYLWMSQSLNSFKIPYIYYCRFLLLFWPNLFGKHHFKFSKVGAFSSSVTVKYNLKNVDEANHTQLEKLEITDSLLYTVGTLSLKN